MGKSSKKEYNYQFNSLRSEIAYEGANNKKASFWTLLPYHFMIDITGEQSVYMGIEYKTRANADEFYEFYQNSGWVNVVRETDSILIKGFMENVTIVTENATPNFEYRITFKRVLDLTVFEIQKA